MLTTPKEILKGKQITGKKVERNSFLLNGIYLCIFLRFYTFLHIHSFSLAEIEPLGSVR